MNRYGSSPCVKVGFGPEAEFKLTYYPIVIASCRAGGS